MMLKHKTLKRCISVFTALVLCLQIFCLSVSAESGTLKKGLKWSLKNGVLEITGSGDMPDFQDGEFAPWHKNRLEITKVILPKGLTSIGKLAFYGCENLTSVELPQKVETVGEYAFTNCRSMYSLKLSQGIKSIGRAAFRGCEKIAVLTFPATLETIEKEAFYGCKSIISLTIPKTIKNVGVQAFAYCTSLLKVTVNAEIETLPKWMFYGCENLGEVVLCPAVHAVDEYTFEDCKNLHAVYTQSYDNEIAYGLEQSIMKNNPHFKNNGFVASYDPPPYSALDTFSGSESNFTILKENENSTVAITDRTEISGTSTNTKTEISAVTDGKEGLKEVTDDVTDKLSSSPTSETEISISLTDTEVSGDALKDLAGKKVTVAITDPNGTQWKIDMSGIAPDDIESKYNFGAEVTSADPKKVKIDSDEVYSVRFSGNNNINATVGIKLGDGTEYKKATLYQKKLFGYSKLQTVVVDADGRAWFKLANTDKNVKYFIGIDGEDISDDEARIPESLNTAFGMSSNPLLIGDDSIEYTITGRKSSWGMDLKTVMIILGIVMFAAVVLIGAVMVFLNKQKLAKEKFGLPIGRKKKK